MIPLPLAIGSRLAIIGIGNNAVLRITAKGKEASPEEVGKEVLFASAKIGIVIATDLLLKTSIATRTVNLLSRATLAVAVPVTVGAITSYAIDPEEGLQNYFYAIDTYKDPEIAQDTKNIMFINSLTKIFGFYGGGGKQKKEGFFEFYS